MTKPQKHKDTKINTGMMQDYLAVLDYYMKQFLYLCAFVVSKPSANHQEIDTRTLSFPEPPTKNSKEPILWSYRHNSHMNAVSTTMVPFFRSFSV